MADLDFFSAVAKLNEFDELDIEAMELLVRIECSGEDFYNLLADRIGNDEAADLLRRNGREETGHARRVQRAMAIKLGRPIETTIDDVERFAVPLPDSIDPALLPVIVDAELKGDGDYQRWAERESDPEIVKLLLQNGREETVHGERVQQVLALLS